MPRRHLIPKRYIIAMEALLATFYFIPGGKPTDADKREATKFSATGGKVVFRDTNTPVESIDPACQGVLGGDDVPPEYRAAFPSDAVAPEPQAEPETEPEAEPTESEPEE